MTWRVQRAELPDHWEVVCDGPLGTIRHGIESPGSPVLHILYPSEWQAQQFADELNFEASA